MSERDQIIAAIERWVEGHPNPDEPILNIGNSKDSRYSPRQILNEMKQGTEFGRMQEAAIIDAVVEFVLGSKDTSSTK